jgi:hypothetical protein
MSADYTGPLFIDRSSATRQVKRAHPLTDRNANFPMIRPRGIGEWGRPMVAKLERVALREAFPSEVKDLSRWVQTNLDELNAVTGLSLANPSVEQPAGDFSVDLIAEDDTGEKVIIENQIGKSDHDHLGKVLTYLTAHEAQAAAPA